MEPKGPVGKGKIETGGSETHGLVRIKSRCGVEEKGKSDLSNTTCRERGIIVVYPSNPRRVGSYTWASIWAVH
jgi:hypothetical protein